MPTGWGTAMHDIFMNPGFIMLGIAAIAGWVWTTRLRIKHGYPLEGSWGQRIEPKLTSEAMERLAQIDTDNARLRAELASVKDRLAVLERIATDQGGALADEIEQLRAAPSARLN